MSNTPGLPLTAKNFKVDKQGVVYVDTSITKGNPGMLLIWATWCGYCVSFKPTYNDISMKLSSEFPCLSIEDSQLTGYDSLKSALNFKGYPSIKFFDQNGKIIGDYTGARDENSLLKSICNSYHHCITYH